MDDKTRSEVTPFSRFEYIGNGGREISLRGSFSISIQDEGRTLKVFGNKTVYRGSEEGKD